MNANQQIDEILQGIWDGLMGGAPGPVIQKKIDELLAEKARNSRDDWHGWECYCDECCQ